MEELFTQKARNALERCPGIAGALGHTYVGSEHLLISLLEEGESVAAHFLEERGMSAKRLREAVCEQRRAPQNKQTGAKDVTPRLRRIIEAAGCFASEGRGLVGTEHLLLALLEDKEAVATKLLSSLSVDTAALLKDIRRYEERRTGGDGSKYKSPISTLPYLEKYGRDLNLAAIEGRIDPLFGREEELSEVTCILTRRTKNNPCLIGEPGVGKTAIVEGLAARIVEGNVPDALLSKTVVLLDLSSMIAGAKYRGEFEDRLKGAVKEAERRRDLILFIDEIHTLVGAGAAEGAVDAANILKPALARGEIHLIGATTLHEYRAHIEKDAALSRRFREVMIKEPSVEESIRILEGLRERYEAHHGLRVTDEAIRDAVLLSARYIHERFLPDKAIDLLDEAASELRLRDALSEGGTARAERELRRTASEKLSAILEEDFERASLLREKEERLRREIDERREGVLSSLSVTGADVTRALAKRTGLSLLYLSESEEKKLLRLEEALGARIVGQEEAIGALSRAIRRGSVRIGKRRRPMGSLLFLGPSGVGKSALCRVLAEELFGTADALIRFDMSEYMEKHSVSRLIGAPPGYVGHGEGGQLTERIRRRPYAVLLWDEVEKAHPDVLSLLLQIMEEGELTDAEGHTVDFSNVLLILTSNGGAKECAQRHPLGFAERRESFERDIRRQALEGAFRPELLGRLDEIVVFSSLSEKELAEIARRTLRELKSDAAARGVVLSFSEELYPFLAARCLKDGGGARGLLHAVTRLIEDPLSALLLSEKRDGELSLWVSVKDNEVILEEMPC